MLPFEVLVTQALKPLWFYNHFRSKNATFASCRLMALFLPVQERKFGLPTDVSSLQDFQASL
jgi:hypothetical protein